MNQLVGKAIVVRQRPQQALDLNGNDTVVVAMTVELQLAEPTNIDLGTDYTLTPVQQTGILIDREGNQL